jgi:hypothetical protein
MSKHTPGPWEVREGKTGDRKIFVKGVRDSYGALAVVKAREGREHINTADAQLIAAAPDLLKCLKEAVANFDVMDHGEGEDDPLNEWRETIAKAEGR